MHESDPICPAEVGGGDFNPRTAVRGRARRLVWAAALVPLVLLAGCGHTKTVPKATPPAPHSSAPVPAAANVVSTATVAVNGTPTTVLTTSSGRTLYYFTPDSAHHVACTGSCTSIWPPLTTSASAIASPPGVSGKLTIFAGANGRQVEYRGHPLYTYSGDSGPDQSHGEGILGKWFVATPSLAAAAAPTPSPSSSSSTPNSGY